MSVLNINHHNDYDKLPVGQEDADGRAWRCGDAWDDNASNESKDESGVVDVAVSVVVGGDVDVALFSVAALRLLLLLLILLLRRLIITETTV